MKQHIIDELRYNDYEKIKLYLTENLGTSEVDGIYWLPLEKRLLTDEQASHNECLPLLTLDRSVFPASSLCVRKTGSNAHASGMPLKNSGTGLFDMLMICSSNLEYQYDKLVKSPVFSISSGLPFSRE